MRLGERRRRGLGAGLELVELRVEPGERPLQIGLLPAQGLEKLAIFGSHGATTMFGRAVGHKLGRAGLSAIRSLSWSDLDFYWQGRCIGGENGP